MKAQQLPTRLYIFFFIISFFIYTPAFSQDNFEDTKIVKNVFKAFKKKKEKIILKSLPNKKDVNYIILLAKAKKPEEIIPSADTIIADFKRDLSVNFKKIIKKGESFGVAWENMVLTKISYASNPDRYIDVERGDITLECESDNKKFLIILKKSYKIRGSWRLMNNIKFSLL